MFDFQLLQHNYNAFILSPLFLLIFFLSVFLLNESSKPSSNSYAICITYRTICVPPSPSELLSESSWLSSGTSPKTWRSISSRFFLSPGICNKINKILYLSIIVTPWRQNSTSRYLLTQTT